MYQQYRFISKICKTICEKKVKYMNLVGHVVKLVYFTFLLNDVSLIYEELCVQLT